MLGKCSNYTAAIVGTTSVEAGLNDKPPVTELRPAVTAHDYGQGRRFYWDVQHGSSGSSAP